MTPYRNKASCDHISCGNSQQPTLEKCKKFFDFGPTDWRWFQYNPETQLCARCQACPEIKKQNETDIYFFENPKCQKVKGDVCRQSTEKDCCKAPFVCEASVCKTVEPGDHPLCFGEHVGNLGPSWVQRESDKEATSVACDGGYCGSSKVAAETFSASFPMQGAGVAIIRFFNGDATDKSSSVKLQRVRKQQKTDLTNTNVGGKNADKIDFIFQYKDGDEMVLSETNTGVIVVDSVRCSDVSEFDISQGFSCSADKKYWVGDFDDLRGVTHKVNKVGQHFWEHQDMTSQLCSALCARVTKCVSFSQTPTNGNVLGTCHLFTTAALVKQRLSGAACGKIPGAVVTTVPPKPVSFFEKLISQWGGWVGISIIVAVGSILLVLIILCATCVIYATCRRCSKKKRNQQPVPAVPSASSPSPQRNQKVLNSTSPQDDFDRNRMPAARTAIPLTNNAPFEVPLNPDEETMRENIHQLKLEIKKTNEFKLECEERGNFDEADRVAARLWQLRERLRRSEDKLFMLLENNSCAGMPATAHVQPAAHGSTNQHGGYDARDDPDKGYHDINEKLEILQNRIKHAQTEEEADRCETEIWELLNALKQENDNLELQRDMEDHHNTDEYAETSRNPAAYGGNGRMPHDRQSFGGTAPPAVPPPPLHDPRMDTDNYGRRRPHPDNQHHNQHRKYSHPNFAAAARQQTPAWTSDSVRLMHDNRGGPLQHDAASFHSARGPLQRDADSYHSARRPLQRDSDSYHSAHGPLQRDPTSFHSAHGPLQRDPNSFYSAQPLQRDSASFHSAQNGRMQHDSGYAPQHGRMGRDSGSTRIENSPYNSPQTSPTSSPHMQPSQPPPPPPPQPAAQASAADNDPMSYVLDVAKKMYGVQLTSRPIDPPMPILRRTVVSSNYLMYHQAATKVNAPASAGVLLFAVDKLINSYCERHKLDGKPFAHELTNGTLEYHEALGENLSSAGMFLWTSALRLPDDNEFCSVLNEALRMDDCQEIAHAVIVSRTILRDIVPFQIPSDGCCWRGAGFDNRYRDFFVQGTRFRVPGLLATSKKESTARKFMNRIVADQSRVLFQIFFDDSRYLTNVQHFKHGSSGKKSEHEYLFAPYSCFIVPTPPQWSSSPSEPHFITLTMDNRSRPVNTILADGVVVEERDNTPLAPWY